MRFLLILFLIGTSITSARADVTTGLVGWWKMDEASSGNCSGASVVDASGSGNTGTCSGSPTYGTGRIGQGAMSFNGSNFIDLGANAVFNITTAITVTAWIKPYSFRTEPDSTIVTKSRSYYFQLDGSGYLEVFMYNVLGNYMASNNPILLNTWQHVAYTYDQSAVNIYINGVLNKTLGANGHIMVMDDHVGIGANLDSTGALFINNYRRFNGAIDDVRIYNRALTGTEVTELYQYNLARIGNAHIVNARLGH